MKLAIIYGTRPEFLKLKCLIDILKENKLDTIVIKIRQHDKILDDMGYFDTFIDIEDMSVERISNIGCNILSKLPIMIKDYTHILAQGDTATVFYSLLCGFQMKKVCIHLEAGMRTYDLENPFPEEGFRQMISRITDIHLCPSQAEKDILESEKVKGVVYIIGNTILDLVKSYNFPITNENKVLITLHRRGNWLDFKEYIVELAKLAGSYQDYTFYFITHPNPTFKQIINELYNIIPKNMVITDSLYHKELIEYLSSCSFVITDSGGIQEEANYLGKKMYVLRKKTERQLISNTKITLCTLDNIKNIECRNFDTTRGFEYGDGNSCKKILDIFYKI